MAITELLSKYNTSCNIEKPVESLGLSAEEAAKRLLEYGPNCLTPPKKKHPFLIFLGFLAGLFNLLLIIAAVLAYSLLYDYANNYQNTYLGSILLGVALMNAFIEYYQMQKSQAILESFLVNLRVFFLYVYNIGLTYFSIYT